MLSTHSSRIRAALLTGIAISFLMVSLKVFFYRPILAMPGGPAFVLETAGLLVAYALLVLWLTRGGSDLRQTALRLGTTLGLVGAAVQILSLTQEHFFEFGPAGNTISGFALLSCTFILWGTAGHRTARITGRARSGALAGFWSAVVTMSILVPFGFLLEFYLAAPKPDYVLTWNEFKRSGWTDVSAFTIANTLDSAQSHLVVGPILGTVLGGIAALFTRRRGMRPSNPVLKPC